MTPGAAVEVREKMPLRLTCRVQTPKGVTNRWAPDAYDPANATRKISFSTVMPGGMENFSTELARDIRRDYPDLEELSKVNVEGVGGLSAGEFRLEKFPRSSQDAATVQPTGVGYQAALDDNEAAREIYADRSFSDWISASVQRKVNLLNTGVGSLEDPSTEPDQTTGNPSEKLSFSGAWAQQIVAEAWYDAKGIVIGGLFFSINPNPNIANISSAFGFGADVYLLDDDVASAYDAHGTIADIASPPYSDWLHPTAGTTRKWAALQLKNGIAPAGAEGVEYAAYYPVLLVVGNHGLNLYDTGEGNGAVGVLASDVCRHAVNTWAPILGTDIPDSQFVIPHLTFLDPTKLSDIIKGASQYELLDWWVDEGPTFHLYDRNSHGNYWRAKAWPSKLQETGPQIDRLWNGVAVQYQDVLGVARTVGPPGSGMDVEDQSLIDMDPLNPCNQTDPVTQRWTGLKMGTGTATTATQVGQEFLQAQKELDQSGQAELPGWVEDANGITWPAWRVRGGDYLSFTDVADQSYRRVVHTDWDDGSKVNAVQLDQPPDALQALLDRLQVALMPLGFT